MIIEDSIQTQLETPIPVHTAEAEATPMRSDALEVLAATSRTFFIPISRLPPGLLEAVVHRDDANLSGDRSGGRERIAAAPGESA